MGLRQSDVRIAGSIAVAVLLSLLAFGALAPTTMIWLHGLDDVIAHADDRAAAGIFGALAVFFASGALFWFVMTRVIERRWPWPLGPRMKRPQRPRVVLPTLLALVTWMIGIRVLTPYLPSASGLYVFDEASADWLNVDAPVDFTIALIAGMLLYITGLTVGVLIVAAWRGTRLELRASDSDAPSQLAGEAVGTGVAGGVSEPALKEIG
jgi:hypothetical protein